MTDREALALIRHEHVEMGKLLDTLASGKGVRSDSLLDAARRLNAAAQTVHNRAVGEPEPRKGE